jgi:CBS domain-containing protein
MTITVRQVLQGKGDRVFTVSPNHSVLQALELMASNDVGSVLVTEGERLAGIFTERDYARKVVLKGRTSAEAKIGELMTCNVLTVSPTQTIDDCMAIMTNNRIRHLPVVEKGQLVGIITIGDAVKTVIEEQQRTISQLSSYISGEMTA